MADTIRSAHYKHGDLDVTVRWDSPSAAVIKEVARIFREKIDAMPAEKQKTGTEG